MKNHIVKKILLLSCLQSVVGRPIRCSLTTNIVRYDPKYPEVDVECVPCPDCPEGQGLSPQCGSRIPNDSKIECKLCLVNETYSNNHGIESCKPCQECHLKNVIQHCTGSQNRICGKKCPQGSFLDDNNVCQECYFCCGNVSEAYRRQGCKDIGMDRNRQCEKTEQNQRCKRALDKPKPTMSPTDKKPTVPHDRNHDMAEKQATSIPHDTSQKLTISQYPSTPTESQGIRKVATSPVNDNNSTNDLSTEKEKGQKENGTTCLGVVSDHVVLGVIIVLAVVILVLVAGVLIYWKRCKSPRKEPEFAANADWIELSQCESDQDSDSSTSQETGSGVDDGPVNDIPEVPKPNPAVIPADRLVSDMESLRDEEGNVMFIYVQTKLDAAETSIRRTWRSVGRAFVSSDYLDLIEADRSRASPTESLLTILKTSLAKEPTMREFVKALINCNRNDVANYICNWPWKIEKIASMGEDQHQKVQDQVIIELGKL